jgi:predicted lipoprotein
MKQLLTPLFLALLLFATACKRPDDNRCATDFDQLELLNNVGSNIIEPSYFYLSTATSVLESEVATFVSGPSLVQLTATRARLLAAWEAWQKAALYEFGPAEEEDLRNFCNNFPANITRINEGLTTGTYDLRTPAYSYARGFPALEYLLYGENKTDAEIIDLFTTDALAANRRQYLNDLATLLRMKTQTVYEAWKEDEGNYLNTFTTTEGVANGTPLSNLINQWNKNYELIKNNRLGDPISAKTGYVPLLPDNVEAYYSRHSLTLLIKAVEAQKALFLGLVETSTTTNEDRVGLDDYLDATDAKKGSENLSTVIINQYDATLAALNALSPRSLQEAITADTEAVKAAYAAAQNLTVLTKTDLPAALCVSITYIDNVDDGD